MSVWKTYDLPKEARQCSAKPGMAGFDADGGVCWMLAKTEFLLWSSEHEPMLRAASLPYAVPRAIVSAVALPKRERTACIVCTPEGNIFVWPELAENTEQAPLQARISQEITSASNTVIIKQGVTSAIASVLGTADGRLYRLDCTSQNTSAEAVYLTPLQQPEKGWMGSLSQRWGARLSPAAKPAIAALHMILDGQDMHLLVLSKTSLDCWQMSVQARSPAQLQWSQPVLSSMQQSSQNVAQLELCSLSAIAMSGSRHNVAVIASTPGNKVVLQLLSVSAKSRAEEFSTHLLQLSSDTDGKLSQRGGKWRCCCGQYNEVLIWQQGGSLYKWTLQTGSVQQDIPGAVHSAVAVTDAETPHWLVLTPAEVVSLPMTHIMPSRSVAPSTIPQNAPVFQTQPAGSTQQQGARLPPADKAAHVPQDQVFQLLSTAVYSPAGDAERAKSVQQLSSIRSRLQEPPGLANDVAVFSNRVIDTLPKQWGRTSAADYLQQLQDKQMYHQTLLTTVDDIQLMHVLDPEALRALFESAEKLEAVSAVREYENLQRADSAMESLGLLQDVVYDAGRHCDSQASGLLEQRSEQEMFYSCPSASAEAFFEAVSSQLTGLDSSTYAESLSSQLEQTIEVAQAVQNVLGKAHARNQELKQAYQREMYRVSTSTPWWSAGLPVRTALQGLADMLARLAEATKSTDAMLFEQCVKWLLTMTEAVLSAFTHAMNTCQAAAVQEALKQDYETARHDYLQVLLVIAADLGEQGGSTTYVQEVEQLADAHRAYAQLFEICEMQGDQHKLHDYMQRHRIMHGSRLDLGQSAMSYVFDRLLEEGQHARLLSFPDLFSQDLSQWLQSRLAAAASDRTQAATLRRLTWLHELRMKQYGAASRTLADVTNNNEGDVARVHRAACIAKLTKLAAVKDPGLKPSKEDLDFLDHQHAKVIMLQVQVALQLGLGQVHDFHQLLTACLKDTAPASCASYVFTLLSHVKSPEQQQGYRRDFEAAWQKAAADTDWQELAEPSQLASDQQVNEILCQTQVCHAAQTCYADPAHNLAKAFPPETVIESVLEMTGAKQDPATRRLVEAALHHGYNGHYVQPLPPDTDPGSPIDMQAD